MLSKELINDIQLYINSLYISLEKQEFPVIRSGSLFDKCKGAFGIDDEEFEDEELFDEELMTESLEDFLQKQDVSFSEYLLHLIDERGLTDAQCYKSANLSRQLFSKIRTEKSYTPRKRTILALAIALELSYDDTQDLLSKAGYTLSHSDKGDIIVEYFIRKGRFDIFEINEALYAFDQALLGG